MLFGGFFIHDFFFRCVFAIVKIGINIFKIPIRFLQSNISQKILFVIKKRFCFYQIFIRLSKIIMKLSKVAKIPISQNLLFDLIKFIKNASWHYGWIRKDVFRLSKDRRLRDKKK